MSAMCAGCQGYRDGYLGIASRIPRDDTARDYCYGYQAGSVLRKDEWASGYRSRAMNDLDIPASERPVFVPRIPQAVA